MVPDGGFEPSKAFSLLPFWFWNDRLEIDELIRQIDEFEARGVHGFVIHPRMGLPLDMPFLSGSMLDVMRRVIEHAASREMRVVLYDEGMYPSGSAAGQVVASNPAFQCRCLDRVPTDMQLPDGANCVGTYGHWRIIDRPVDSVIRGIHYEDEAETKESEPPAGDILNPDAVTRFIELVHERFAHAFGEHFGQTIIGVFTDEPNPLGRCREQGVWPGTRGVLDEVNRLLGEDFAPFLPALFDDSFPQAETHRQRYHWAICRRLEETWYRPLHEWCDRHGLWLMGHPDRGDEIGVQRYFHVPGQDLVWRWVLPDTPSALEGPESTQAKCSSSAMIHLGRQRNSNEFCGAYGHELTFEQMQWLANWCLVRGVNLLIPHAFYYSVRGPRRDERPPDVGPNSTWWDRFKPFADHCRRLCWINTDCQHHCDVVVMAEPDHCPWAAAKALFENQIDFNYLDTRQFIEEASVDQGLKVSGMHYRAVIVEPELVVSPAMREKLDELEAQGRLVRWQGNPAALVKQTAALTSMSLQIDEPQPALRVRHVTKEGNHYFLLFNECAKPIRFQFHSPDQPLWRVNTGGDGGLARLESTELHLAGYEMMTLRVPVASIAAHA